MGSASTKGQFLKGKNKGGWLVKDVQIATIKIMAHIDIAFIGGLFDDR